MAIVYKKRGRKKKRGRRKKKNNIPHPYIGRKRPYHVILTQNNVQMGDICSCVDYKTARKKMLSMSEESLKKVIFPLRFIAGKDDKTFHECEYKLVMIRREFETDTQETGRVRNEYGKFIDCVTDNDKWSFLEELPYVVEESFWVYGYNPKSDRKTFKFICDNIISRDADDKYYLKMVVTFKNKLLVDSLDGLEMVICKNHQDSVRMYNMICEYSEKKKMKYITFCGDVTKKSYSFMKWYDKIKGLTNWTNRKIMKNTTRD